MIREEIQIVKRRLDDYAAYKYLALEADRNALGTSIKMQEIGAPKSPQWDKVAPSQNHLDLASIYNELISDCQQYERDAAKWHKKMKAIEVYITDCFDGEIQRIMRLHYIDGLTYEKLGEDCCMSPEGLKSAVFRALKKADFADAQTIL